LLGWEPGEVTTFEYDDAGRMIRAVTVREPEFSDWDRAALLADRTRDLAPRSRTGILMSEATDRKNFGRFIVPEPTTDLASKALHEAQEQWKAFHGEHSLDHLLWRVELED